jgi:hypothetical protein
MYDERTKTSSERSDQTVEGNAMWTKWILRGFMFVIFVAVESFLYIMDNGMGLELLIGNMVLFLVLTFFDSDKSLSEMSAEA